VRHRSRGERLGAVPLFGSLTAKQLAAVEQLVTRIEVAPGRELIQQGKPGRELILVIEGEAEVRRDGERIAVRGPGTFMGETSLLLNQPRNASVVALTEMTIEVIDQRAFATRRS
jgi:CRP/FNR family transcriptional regulator, cyclic AMP receptor protein